MRIACPSCNAAYQVPEEQLRGGRVVRCARCNTDWAPNVALPEPEPSPAPPVSAVEPAVEPPIDSTADPEPVSSRRMALDEADLVPSSPAPVAPKPSQPKPAPSQPRSPALAIAWVASLAVVAAAIAYLAIGRANVMRAWPPSIRLYAALGMAPQPTALKTD